MAWLLAPFIVGFVCIVPVYLHAFCRLYKIVQAERPEWLAVRGSLSSLYDGLGRWGDPNVQIALLGVAFSARPQQLQAPMAVSYAQRIRLLLPLGLFLFTAYVLGLMLSAP